MREFFCRCMRSLLSFIKRRMVERYFIRHWNDRTEWFLPDKISNDAIVYKVRTNVWVITYYYIGAKVRPNLGETSLQNSIDASDIIWSRKTISLTNEAMWEAYEIVSEAEKKKEAILNQKRTLKEIEEYFATL